MRTFSTAGLICAALLVATAASAQTAGTTNGTSNATNSVNVNTYTGGGGASGSDGTGNGTTANVHYSGHQYSTPSVQGSYFAGANPCLIGVGASGAGGPIGLSFTFGRSDEGCQRRSDAAAWHALGHDDVAMARMCQDDDNSAAFESLGYTCPQHRPKTAPVAFVPPPTPSAPITYPQPVSPNPTVAVQPTPGVVATRLPTGNDRPDWCGTVTGTQERLRYRQVCSF